MYCTTKRARYNCYKLNLPFRLSSLQFVGDPAIPRFSIINGFTLFATDFYYNLCPKFKIYYTKLKQKLWLDPIPGIV